MSRRTADLIRTRFFASPPVRSAMSRSVMRLGPVHVLVIAASPPLRQAITEWLRGVKRVRIVRSIGSVAELNGHKVDCDLVVASALDGSRELRAIGRRFADSAGLVALSLGTAPLPRGWTGILPGASRAHVLDHAMLHPERSLAASWTVVSAIVVAVFAAAAAFVYVPQTGVSFQRAVLAYAAAYPEIGTWWHVWGSGAPFLALASWPLLKLGAMTGTGHAAFVLLAAAVGAVYAVAFLLLALRAGARQRALVVALAAMLPPALWVWPRGGDVSSLAGLAGVALAFAGSAVGRMRFLATAIAVVVSSPGGVLWVAATALVAMALGIRSHGGGRARSSIAGAIAGVLISAAVVLPPVLSRGLEGLRPPLLRPIALSDAAPLVASAALIALVLAGSRMRRPVLGAAAAALIAANALAVVVPVTPLDLPVLPSSGPHGRLAVHPAQALEIVTRSPVQPVTGDEVPAGLMVGAGRKEATNTFLERLGVDRAMTPDRSAAIIFNERDWPVLDREQLIFESPFVRPVLTAGITMTLLVVADEADVRVVRDALVELGTTSDRVIGVRTTRTLDELDITFLRQFTMVVIYGQPWRDIGRATGVLQQYLDASGFVLMDVAGRTGRQPLLPDAEPLQAGEDQFRTHGEGALALVTAEKGFPGRLATIGEFSHDNDPAWEHAALLVGARRVIQFGARQVASEALAAHLVWSGADLPGRTAAGDVDAREQLQKALQWMLGAAGVEITGGYGRPDGTDILDNELSTSTFVDPARWRIDMKVASTGVLFKQRHHPQWRAYIVDVAPLSGAESLTPLAITPTIEGHMYVTLPPNARRVDFVFERHPLEAAARGLSAVALFITIAISFFLWRRT